MRSTYSTSPSMAKLRIIPGRENDEVVINDSAAVEEVEESILSTLHGRQDIYDLGFQNGLNECRKELDQQLDALQTTIAERDERRAPGPELEAAQHDLAGRGRVLLPINTTVLTY